MVRRGGWAAALLLVACAGGDGDAGGPTSTVTAPPRPELPATVEPGEAALVLGDRLYRLDVTSCQVTPTTDAATNVVTEVAVVASDPLGARLDVRRSSFEAAAPTVTDTVFFTDGAAIAVESERVDADGRILDLRAPGAFGRLIEVDAGTVSAAGVFGTPDARGPEPTDVEGALLLRCPA